MIDMEKKVIDSVIKQSKWGGFKCVYLLLSFVSTYKLKISYFPFYPNDKAVILK